MSIAEEAAALFNGDWSRWKEVMERYPHHVHWGVGRMERYIFPDGSSLIAAPEVKWWGGVDLEVLREHMALLKRVHPALEDQKILEEAWAFYREGWTADRLRAFLGLRA